MHVDEYQQGFGHLGAQTAVEELAERVEAKHVRTPSRLVREFHEAFGQPVHEGPFIPTDRVRDLRESLLSEEFNEYLRASWDGDIVGIADALADMIYVIYGTALVYGIDLDEVLAEVHRSNMSKLGEDGKPLRRHDGKILKGPNYSPPDLQPILFGA